MISENDELRHELEIYKSVAVPPEVKPRTFVTRVARAPLASQNLNAMPLSSARGTNLAVSSVLKRLEATPENEYREGDMTLDEIL